MTVDTLALARRAVTCKAWKWLPGMVATDTDPQYRVSCDRLYLAPEGHLSTAHIGGTEWTPPRRPPHTDVPDLTDRLTVLALLLLVQDAWGEPRISLVANTVYGTWMVLCPDDNAPDGERLIGCAAVAAEALVMALECTP